MLVYYLVSNLQEPHHARLAPEKNNIQILLELRMKNIQTLGVVIFKRLFFGNQWEKNLFQTEILPDIDFFFSSLISKK